MGNVRKTAALIMAGAMICLTTAGCGQQSNQTPPGDAPSAQAAWPETPTVELVDGKPGGTFRFGITEPTAIDPYNAQESEGLLVTRFLFTGLVQVEPDGTPTPGVAESWQPNADCSEWTFALKSGTTFSNGEPVDATSFKRGWERAAIRSAASQVAYHMEPIKGFAEMQAGKAEHLSGVVVTDPNTLTVTLESADCEFFLRMIHPVFSPVPTTAGPADNKKYNDQPIGNGPFKMDGPWEHDNGLRLVRNDSYGAGPKAHLDAAEISITPRGNEDEVDGFVNGTFDWARMPVPRLTQERATYEPQGMWITKNTNGMNYLEPHSTVKPLDSVAARKAISMAIDRNAIIQGVFQGSQTPATSLVPPVFTDAYQAGVCDACTFDPAKAKELAAEAGLVPGTELKMQFNADAGHEEWMAAIKQQLETTLGLKVTMTSVPFTDLIENRRQPGSSGLYRASWGADYPTPGNYLGPLVSTVAIGTTDPSKPATGDNMSRYSNPEVDRLLAEAKASTDAAKRTSLYQEAERIAIGTDLALIPTWNRTQHRLADTAEFTNLRMDFNENPDLSVISIK